MSSPSAERKQEAQWMALYRLILKYLTRHGSNGIARDDDFFVVDENIVWHQHKVELGNLALLRPEVIDGLQRLLAAFPGWEIVVGLSAPDREGVVRNMGLTIRRHEIVGGLQRQYLPDQHLDYRYRNSVPR